MKLPRIVEVEWVDAAANSGWMTKEERASWVGLLYVCRTVGYLVSNTKEEITVTGTLSDIDAKSTGLQQIPRGMVKRLRYLR